MAKFSKTSLGLDRVIVDDINELPLRGVIATPNSFRGKQYHEIAALARQSASARRHVASLLAMTTLILSFAKVMEHYPFYYIPLTLPSPPTTGERIKVRGSNVMAIFVPLFK
jgi:hypothetical protein